MKNHEHLQPSAAQDTSVEFGNRMQELDVDERGQIGDTTAVSPTLIASSTPSSHDAANAARAWTARQHADRAIRYKKRGDAMRAEGRELARGRRRERAQLIGRELRTYTRLDEMTDEQKVEHLKTQRREKKRRHRAKKTLAAVAGPVCNSRAPATMASAPMGRRLHVPDIG